MLHKLAVSFHQITLSTAFPLRSTRTHMARGTHRRRLSTLPRPLFSHSDLIYYTGAGILELNEPLNGNYTLPPLTPLIWNLGCNCLIVWPLPHLFNTLCPFIIFYHLSLTHTLSAPVNEHSLSLSRICLFAVWEDEIMGELDADACSYRRRHHSKWRTHPSAVSSLSPLAKNSSLLLELNFCIQIYATLSICSLSSTVPHFPPPSCLFSSNICYFWSQFFYPQFPFPIFYKHISSAKPQEMFTHIVFKRNQKSQLNFGKYFDFIYVLPPYCSSFVIVSLVITVRGWPI